MQTKASPVAASKMWPNQTRRAPNQRPLPAEIDNRRFHVIAEQMHIKQVPSGSWFRARQVQAAVKPPSGRI